MMSIKRNSVLFVLSVFLACFGVILPAAANNLISDGSFETPPVTPPNSTCGLYGPAQCFNVGESIGPWQVIGKTSPTFATVMLMTNSYNENGLPFSVQNGNQAIDLTGEGNQNTTSGVDEGVKQVLSLSPGQYSLSFWVGHQESTAAGYTGGPSLVDLWLGFGGNNATFVQEFSNGTDNTSAYDVYWQQFTWNFSVPTSCGSSCLTNIAFINNTYAGNPLTGAPGNNYAGLDNVSLVQTPEPASLVLLGCGFIGLLTSRRLRR